MTKWQPIEKAPRDGSAILLGAEIDAPVGERNFIIGVRGLQQPGNVAPFIVGNLIYYASHWAPITSPVPHAGLTAAKWSI